MRPDQKHFLTYILNSEEMNIKLLEQKAIKEDEQHDFELSKITEKKIIEFRKKREDKSKLLKNNQAALRRITADA